MSGYTVNRNDKKNEYNKYDSSTRICILIFSRKLVNIGQHCVLFLLSDQVFHLSTAEKDSQENQ